MWCVPQNARNWNTKKRTNNTSCMESVWLRLNEKCTSSAFLCMCVTATLVILTAKYFFYWHRDWSYKSYFIFSFFMFSIEWWFFLCNISFNKYVRYFWNGFANAQFVREWGWEWEHLWTSIHVHVKLNELIVIFLDLMWCGLEIGYNNFHYLSIYWLHLFWWVVKSNNNEKCIKIQPTVIFNIPFIQYSVEPFPNTIISLQNQMKIETIYPDSTNFISIEHSKKLRIFFVVLW